MKLTYLALPAQTVLFAACLTLANRASAQSKFIVHEWGTFTSLQNESGDAIGGINTDDEPVPPFVHRLADFLLLRPTEVPNNFFQGAPSCHPDVTMRLETPVIYFHPPKSETKIQTANVRVKFHGGWLSEYFPDAFADAAEFTNSNFGPGPARLFRFGALHSTNESSLTWDNLKIGGDWPMTNTSAHVWTSPRAVNAASVQTTNGESEKFLFYRGVAHIDAPLKISRDAATGELLFRSHLENLPTDTLPIIRAIWLVNIRPDGKIAFRALPPLSLDHKPKKILAHTPADFSPGDFSSGNFETLKTALKTTLVSEGLFADEAQALLNTWELSYFKSAGLRVFFIVPRAWTDFYLPLEISPRAEMNRVMVGRIELVTPDQRERLHEIAQFSPAQIQQDAGLLWTNFYGKITFHFTTNRVNPQRMQKINREMADVNSGRETLASFVPVPQTYQTYLNLGRFRNALILDEARQHPTEGLSSFIATYLLEAYKPKSN